MFATLFYTRQVYSLHFLKPPSFNVIFIGDRYLNYMIVQHFINNSF